MPRGGGGGRGGGATGRPGDGIDEDLKPFIKPSELFPPYRVPVADLPTDREKRQVAYYISLRDQIHQGPLYSKARTRDPTKPFKTYGEDHFNSLHELGSKATFDPFDGVPRYTHKYQQKQRFMPQFVGRTFSKDLFPEELHATVDGEEENMLKTKKRKAAAISTIASANHLTPEEKARLLEEKLRSLETADAEGDVVVDDDAEAPEEDVDYDYEDDEDEMGGDYAAEQYFDDGAADEDDDAGNDYD